MNERDSLSFDRLLETLAEKLATRLATEPSRLYPRLMTIDLAATYLDQTHDAIERLASSGKIPIVFADNRVLLDRADLDEWIEDHKAGWAYGTRAAGSTYSSSSGEGSAETTLRRRSRYGS